MLHGNSELAPAAGAALRRLALALLLLMLVVTSASAWLRLAAQPRAACADWPACRSAPGAAATMTAPVAGDVSRASGALASVASVRLVHRIAATAALLGIVAMLVVLLRQPRALRDRVALRWAAVLLVLALALSALGVATPGAQVSSESGVVRNAVLLGNVLGGLMMVGAAARLAAHLRNWSAVPPPLAQQASRLAGLWLVQVALGALSGALALRLAPPLHLLLAMTALPWALALGAWAWRSGSARAGIAVLAAAGLQLLLGILAVTESASVTTVLAHNAGAALSLAALAALVARGRA